MQKITIRRYCPEQLIESALDKGMVRELALFVRLKGICSHGWFRGKRAFARKHNIKHSAFSYQINRLIEMGLIKKSGDVYKLISRKEIQAKYKTRHCCTILFRKEDSITQIQYLLLHKLKERSARQQQRNISDAKLIELNKKGSLAAVKRITKTHGGYESFKEKRLEKMKYKELLVNVGFTHAHVGKSLGVSKSTAYRLAKLAEERKLCKTTVLKKEIAKMSFNEFTQLREVFLEKFTHVLWAKGSVHYNVCSLYKQLPYWVEPTTPSPRTTSAASDLLTKK